MDATINSIPSFCGGRINKEHLTDLLLSGKSTAEASLVVGCCKSTADRARRELVASGLTHPLVDSKKVEIITMREAGADYEKIAVKTSRTVGYVRALCWQLGMTNELQNKR